MQVLHRRISTFMTGVKTEIEEKTDHSLCTCYVQIRVNADGQHYPALFIHHFQHGEHPWGYFPGTNECVRP